MFTSKESSVKIFFSTDYSLFRMINGNRQLSAAKIKRIQKDIATGLDVLRFCPIIVSENNDLLNIIDGQHRFYVAKQLKKPIHYVIMDKSVELSEIARINSNTENWKNKDFINCYAQQNNQHYITLQFFADRWKLPITTAIGLLSQSLLNDGSGKDSQGFKEGLFQVKYLKEAEQLMPLVEKFSAFGYYKTRPFILALQKAIKADKCDIAELIEKYLKDPAQLQRQATYKDYLTNLEAIYNKNCKIRHVIY